jgi:hypothetical protein
MRATSDVQSYFLHHGAYAVGDGGEKGCVADISFSKPIVKPLDPNMEVSVCATSFGLLIPSLFCNQ